MPQTLDPSKSPHKGRLHNSLPRELRAYRDLELVVAAFDKKFDFVEI